MPSLAPTRADLRSTAFAAGVVTLVALLVVDLGCFAVVGAFGASALVTAALGGTGATLAVAGLSVVAVVVSGVSHDVWGHTDFDSRALISLVIAALAVAVANTRRRHEAGLQRMTVIAEAAQRAVLRTTPEALGSLGFATRYVSASEGAMVGGDLYEVASTPSGVRVVIGDVSGKGLPAVQTASTVLSAFRQAAFTEPDLVDLARHIDLAVAQQVGDEQFVTALVAEFGTGTVRIANCGHPFPVLITRSGAERLQTVEESPPLGLGADPVVTRHPWTPGSRLLLHTDGLLEQRDRQGRFFPVDQHLDDLREGTLDQALDRLVAALAAHGNGRIADDVALVLAENRA